jgi:serine/threonine protein phosphatase PrpC
MSRSIGDLVAASVGVSYEPEILEYSITPDDRFIVLGSDGIFEFLSNEDIVKIVVPFWKQSDPQGA